MTNPRVIFRMATADDKIWILLLFFNLLNIAHFLFLYRVLGKIILWIAICLKITLQFTYVEFFKSNFQLGIS